MYVYSLSYFENVKHCFSHKKCDISEKLINMLLTSETNPLENSYFVVLISMYKLY